MFDDLNNQINHTKDIGYFFGASLSSQESLVTLISQSLSGTMTSPSSKPAVRIVRRKGSCEVNRQSSDVNRQFYLFITG
uniref:Uncharacterized protein n=1 Tax=Tanacetum cinerariifolium TaxID=118510 RepID=A0A6L2KHQ5_TANCI|nr:hypothetical protein [Tanacetum cinerariifolium]